MNNPFGKSPTGKWLERNAGENLSEVSRIISKVNEETNFLRAIHEGGQSSELLQPYKRHIRRTVHESYLYWKDSVRSNANLFFKESDGEVVPNKVGPVMIAYLRQRYREFFGAY